MDDVPRANRQKPLGPSASLGADRAFMPPSFLFWIDFHARSSLGNVGGACGAHEVERRGLFACLPGVAACDGLDRRRLGSRRRRASPQTLARPAPRCPLFGCLACELCLQPHHMGRSGIHHAQRPNGARYSAESGGFCACDVASRLTPPRIPIKLDKRNRGCPDLREPAAVRFFPPIGWEIVQLVGLQTLDLAILVRVQVSQPTISLNRRSLTVRTPSYLGYYLGYVWVCPELPVVI